MKNNKIALLILVLLVAIGLVFYQTYSMKHGVKYGDMWSKYFDIQLGDKSAVGYSPDFLSYCVKSARGCGFDSTLPEFDKQFHGHFNGFIALKGLDGIYRYFPVR